MPTQVGSPNPSNPYGVGPSFAIVPLATVALAAAAGIMGAGDRWIYWVVAAGSIAMIVWGALRWPPPVPGPVGQTARVALFAGLGLFAVGQFLLGLVSMGAEPGSTNESLTGLNGTASTVSVFGALIGLPGFVLTVALIIAVRLGWTEGSRLWAVIGAVGVAVVVLIAAIVSSF
jgi:hypothetical protein